MFGHLGGSGVRRARRRLGIVIAGALLGALVLGELIDMVVDSYGPAAQTATRSWAATVTPMLTQSGSLASFVRAVRAPQAAGDCPTRCALGVLVSQTMNERQQLAALRLPAPAGLGAGLSRVLTARADGVQALMRSLDLATAPGGGSGPAAAALVTAGNDFLTADRADRALTTALRKNLPTPWVTSWISSPSSWGASAAAGFVAAVAQLPGLASPNSLKFLAISLLPPPNSYSGAGIPELTTTTTTSTTTTTTTVPVAGGAIGAATTTSTSTAGRAASTTTTTLALPVGFAQIPPPGVTSELLPTPRLSVIVVVENDSGRARAVTLAAALAPNSRRSVPTVRTSHLAPLAAGATAYVTLPALAVSPRANAYTLTVTARAPGATGASRTISLQIGR